MTKQLLWQQKMDKEEQIIKSSFLSQFYANVFPPPTHAPLQLQALH